MTVQHVSEEAVAFTTIAPDTKEQDLHGVQQMLSVLDFKHTSLIFDFRKGFLMYHVEFKKVRTNMSSSVFPDSSNLSGDVLQEQLENDCE